MIQYIDARSVKRLSQRAGQIFEIPKIIQLVNNAPRPVGTPKNRVDILREPMRRVFKDGEFLADYKKVIGEEFEPVMPEAVDKAIREVPRDPEVIELVKKLSGPGPMPPR